MKYVQAYISNISFPTSLEELYDYARMFNVEMLLGCDYYCLLDDNNCLKYTNDEYESRSNSWTAPKWCKKGDIVFFMHSKTANSRISALKTKLISERKNYNNNSFWFMMNALIRARKIYDTYGGKIFAIGEVSGAPEYDNSDTQTLHWKSNIYAEIDNVFLLEKPIDISDFNSVITVSRQSGITPVFGSQYHFLKELVLKKNTIVEDYFIDAVAETIPLSKVTDENWLKVVNKYRRSFFLEIQFRTYYVDRLLKLLGDNKTIYRECTCIKNGNPASFVDNVIKINGKYLPIEVKLSISAEKNIVGQLEKYCQLKELKLSKDKIISSGFYTEKVLVIDTEELYLYNDETKALLIITKLDELSTNNDIQLLRDRIIKLL